MGRDRGGTNHRLDVLTAEIPDSDLGEIWLVLVLSRLEQQRFEMLQIFRRQARFSRIVIAQRNHRPPMGAPNRAVRAVGAVAFLAIALPSFLPRDKRVQIERRFGLHRTAVVLAASAELHQGP
jgi:hypothetical protein